MYGMVWSCCYKPDRVVCSVARQCEVTHFLFHRHLDWSKILKVEGGSRCIFLLACVILDPRWGISTVDWVISEAREVSSGKSPVGGVLTVHLFGHKQRKWWTCACVWLTICVTKHNQQCAGAKFLNRNHPRDITQDPAKRIISGSSVAEPLDCRTGATVHAKWDLLVMW